MEEEEAPDYHEYIERPMDLSQMMERLDNDEYVTTRQWLDDIDLICHNCLEYNPNTTQEGWCSWQQCWRLSENRAVCFYAVVRSKPA